MAKTCLTFSLDEAESFGDGRELVLIHNEMSLMSVMAMKGHKLRKGRLTMALSCVTELEVRNMESRKTQVISG